MSLWKRNRPDAFFYPGAEMAEKSIRADGATRGAIETGRGRLLVTGGVFVLAFLAIAGRMVELMALKHEPGAEHPRPVAEVEAVGPARGDILDRNGLVLATNLPTVNLYADPGKVIDAANAAAMLHRALPELDRSEVQTRLSEPRRFVYLARNLTPKQQAGVHALGLPGLGFERAERRVYPQGRLVAHVVGATDVDNNGVAGVEKAMETTLRGGGPVTLALDLRVQKAIREELSAAVEHFKAVGAAGLVQDVRTGEVLGMISLPDYEPADIGTADPDAVFNRISLGVYEMGSTFKLFTAAMALDAGTVNLQGGYDATEPMRMGRFTIDDTHPKRRWLSVPEIVVYSSNIGSAKMALAVGAKRQQDYLARLGLLSPAPIELPETGSPLFPGTWREINTVTISYGHGIAVTPLSLSVAAGTLVNGGYRVRPTLTRRADGRPIEAKRVLAPETSDAMRKLMRMVVTQGTAKKAEVEGYLVGGKTGTAEKVAGRGYDTRKLRTSFIAAFPMDAPRYTVIVVLDEPKGLKETHNFATAGWNAAPTAGRIIAKVGPILGVPPARPDHPEGDAILVALSAQGNARASR